MVRFTADIHLWHKSVLEMENRPFSNIEYMHEKIREWWNKTVGKDDDTWILGDVAFNKHCDPIRDFIESLNGRKHLVLGNHDDLFRAFTWQKMGFTSVHTTCQIKIGGNKIWLAHHPDARERYGLDKNCILFHGHEHKRGHGRVFYTDKSWNVNVGMDLWDFKPITMDEILIELSKEY